jgi:hypothetical protein
MGAFMAKVGLIFQLISFLMFFWDAEIRTLLPMEKGGGFCTTSFDKEIQLKIAFSFIPWETGRLMLSKHFHGVSAALFILGTLFQFG